LIIHSQKHNSRNRPSALVAIHKRMVLHKVEKVCRRHLEKVGVKKLAAKRSLRLSQGGL